MADSAALRHELQQLSPAQLRELLSASGHGQLLRGEEEQIATAAVDEQLLQAAKDEGNALFRQGRLEDAVAAYSRYPDVVGDEPFMRRATAYIALQEFQRAVEDLVAALEFEPRNKDCRAKLENIVDAAVDAPQDSGGARANLRKAGVRAALVLSIREGWTTSDVRGNPGPAAVNGHTLFQGGNGRIYLFGGRAVREQKAGVFVRDESNISSWDTVPTSGVGVPSSRAWHSTSSIGTKEECYCVYGGVSSQGEDPNIHLLVPASPRGFQWIVPRCVQDPKESPVPRSGHAAVSVANDTFYRSIYIFGGRTKRGVSDQLLALRCSPSSDTNDASDPNDVAVVWQEVNRNERDNGIGEWPSARDGHSLCLLQATNARASRLVLFGGNGQLNEEKMNDVWLFDLEKQSWTELTCSGDIPPPRSYHTAHTIGEFLFIVGGRTTESEDCNVYVLDVCTAEWSKVPIPSAHTLTPRAWHSSVLTEAGKLFVLGGGTYHGPLKDAATLDLSYFHTKASSLSHTDV
ncbi:unnamed protein product [Phytophthora lilii]|uniref:Unnamed protein product n=1 Tax=Phytophthora lilii TaxID=2077276 RepID=A0A9W6X2F0_9STRA|nr:unnamed protein product [Phytophthora lilii]